MKIDLFKLNSRNYIEIDEDALFPQEYYENTDIRNLINVHVTGNIKIDSFDELYCNLEVSGTFILPCAITLDDVPYNFNVRIEDNIGKYEDFYNKNKNFLDILPILWENIVLEVPIRVVKEGIEDVDLSGEGWTLVSDVD